MFSFRLNSIALPLLCLHEMLWYVIQVGIVLRSPEDSGRTWRPARPLRDTVQRVWPSRTVCRRSAGPYIRCTPANTPHPALPTQCEPSFPEMSQLDRNRTFDRRRSGCWKHFSWQRCPESWARLADDACWLLSLLAWGRGLWNSGLGCGLSACASWAAPGREKIGHIPCTWRCWTRLCCGCRWCESEGRHGWQMSCHTPDSHKPWPFSFHPLPRTRQDGRSSDGKLSWL